MNSLVKAVAVLALVCSGAQAANAQGYPDPASNPSGGALIVSIWDPVASVSLVYAVPDVFYQQTGALAPTQFNVPEFGQVFAGSNSADILYHVYAAGVDANNNNRGAIFVTGPAGLPNVTTGNVQGNFTAAQTFYSNLDDICGAQTPCTTTDPTSGAFAGVAAWGNLSAQLPFSAAETVGNALSFYAIGQATGSRVRPTDPATVDAIAGGTAQWLLDASGLMSYSVIPIPAAAWLLLSGLLGFGAISRRRQPAAA